MGRYRCTVSQSDKSAQPTKSNKTGFCALAGIISPLRTSLFDMHGDGVLLATLAT
jgi:hypothetical protein